MNRNGLERIKYLIIDVDGTMTDAGIYYDSYGNEWKKFCTKDAAGFFAAKMAGIKLMVLTGRKCDAVTKRMKELNVDFLYQDIKDKITFLREFLKEYDIQREEIGYLGDDLNDLVVMKSVGFSACPEDACLEVKAISDYISPVKGGQGAVRDIISYILKERGEWETLVNKIYGGI